MLTPTGLHDSATRALSELSHSPVETLRAAGYKGGQGSCSCPVQRYLTARVPLPEGATWYVTRASANVLTEPGVSNTPYLHVELPMEVRHFIALFDAGNYLDLRDNEVE